MSSSAALKSKTRPRKLKSKPVSTSPKKISEWILIKGAREHNLKNVSIDIPKNKLIVLTGPSGSGKSTLAFDTIFAEGQRRYIESLSAYAKQFVEQLKKPNVESITGLCPSLAIQQKKISQNPRSTVATISEIYDYLRLLYSRVGEVFHPKTGEKISVQSLAQISDQVFRSTESKKISVLAILAESKKGSFVKEIEKLVRQGYVRAQIDGTDYELQLGQKLEKNKPHTIYVYIDRLHCKESSRLRLEEAIEKASEIGEGRFMVHDIDADKRMSFSRSLSSADGSFSISEMTPRIFSFNSPMGACPTCRGLGYLSNEDDEGADFDEVFEDADAEDADEESENSSREICPDCEGSRLKLESRSVFVGKKDISEVHSMSILDAKTFVDQLSFTGNQKEISKKIIEELSSRLGFLEQVGLDYLQLNRPTATLSGGEEQRVRLATQMGVRLRGVLYVLDEPSIGLHQVDNNRLIAAMKQLRDLGNTVLVVEHDLDTMLAADEVIDLGPGAGVHGGEVVDQASPKALSKGVTADYLRGRRKIAVPETRRPGSGKELEIQNANLHNLKKVSVQFPLSTFTVVTGVSGSGKSSLVMEVLARSVREGRAVGCSRIKGLQHVDKLIQVSQSPIGRTTRSNPATYIGLYSLIRDLFSKTSLARQRGYSMGRFSFNVKGGRCETCEGVGALKVEMHFMPNVQVTCETCFGRRYNSATLEVLYKAKNIAEVLEMTFAEAESFFEAIPQIHRKIQVMNEVGLGYLKLGQAATTLSGGEAQRVKLSKELSKRQTGNTVYILDEPTTGLHLVDVELLLQVCQRLVDQGNSVIMIEHHLDVIKSADYVIDLGPLGGARGGELIAAGAPEHLAGIAKSHTGKFLKQVL